jgi:hypothetical protein
MMAYYARQQELNRRQTCMYNGTTVGGTTNGTVNCM